MHRKLSLGLTLVAWLFATGSQWDLVQTFAWSRMIATYSESMPFFQAVEKTFSGEELCPICAVVQDARQTESSTSGAAAAQSLGKIFLIFAPACSVFAEFIPSCAMHFFRADVPLSTERSAPPSPPPRGLA